MICNSSLNPLCLIQTRNFNFFDLCSFKTFSSMLNENMLLVCFWFVCFFLTLILFAENHLELESQVALNGRKKSPLKRIIGFQVPFLILHVLIYFFVTFNSYKSNFSYMHYQYCPSDPKKLMVTSGDSQVRILDGLHVISNYKGTDTLF